MSVTFEEDIGIQNEKLARISNILSNLLQLEAAEVPEIFRQYRFEVTDKESCIDVTVAPSMPWIGFTIVNDGKSQVYVFVNEKVDIREHEILHQDMRDVAPLLQAPLYISETKTYNMKFSGIKRIYLQCDAGNVSQVRIFSFGKRPVKVKENE